MPPVEKMAGTVAVPVDLVKQRLREQCVRVLSYELVVTMRTYYVLSSWHLT